MNKILYPTVFNAVFILTACGGSGSSFGDSPVNVQKATPIAVKASEPLMSPQEALLERGRIVFKRCSSCHTLEQGARHRVGPNLWNISGSPAAAKEGFAYSAAMKQSGFVWTDDVLSGYLENPRKYLPRGKMSFAGLRKVEDRDAVIAYVKSQTTPE